MPCITTSSPEGRPYDTAINIASCLNEWMDYTFTVSSCRDEDAIKALTSAWIAWWDDDQGVTMFEALEQALEEEGIQFESTVNETEEDY